MVSVDGFVHRAHVFGGDFPSECIEGGLDLRPALERLVAHQRNRLVGREIVAIVVEDGEPERLDGAVGGVGGDHVHLVRVERAVEQAQVHGARRLGEFEAVGRA